MRNLLITKRNLTPTLNILSQQLHLWKSLVVLQL